ncbi:MAG: signal peptidase II, partial [Phycisphaeraceae bacterium]
MEQPPPSRPSATPPPPRTHPPTLHRAGRSPSAVAIFVAATLAVLVGDLALKYVAFRTVAGQPVELDAAEPRAAAIPEHEAVEVIPHVLSLQLTLNEGAVFGLGQGGRWVFIVVSVVAVVVILHIFRRSRADAWVFHLGLALILGGALGNLYDRVRYGAVRDMLFLFPDVRVFGYRPWPYIFNLADAALMVGVGLVIVIMWVNE